MTPDEIKTAVDLHGKWLRSEGGGERANLEGANLQSADLVGANLVGANLQSANLERANLQSADLEGANLVGANLQSADLVGANLQSANLERANLERADLWGANLQSADLVGAKYGDKIITGLIARVTRIADPYEFFAWRTDAGDYIKAGCRFLTVAEYREHAETYKGRAKYAETIAILDFIDARFAATAPKIEEAA